MTIFFTSDLHLGHSNVIKYCRRPFANADEMDATIIKNWNRVVTPKDTVYILGDFAFHSAERAIAIARGLNGHKHLVFGNHDRGNRSKYAAGKTGGPFQSVSDLKEINHEGQKIVMCHYALLTWHGSSRGAWMLHGHSHGSLKTDTKSRRLDVGVDCFGFTPVSFDEVAAIMAKRSFKPLDHHGREADTEDL